MNERLYGFKVKTLPWGERVPDTIWPVRFFMHFFWLAAFHAVPTMWQLERSGKRRNRIGVTVLQSFAWWAYQHEKYRGYSQEHWRQFELPDNRPEAFL